MALKKAVNLTQKAKGTDPASVARKKKAAFDAKVSTARENFQDHVEGDHYNVTESKLPATIKNCSRCQTLKTKVKAARAARKK
jgi:hypothetical protein